MRSRNRVVITGMGIVAPNGIGIEPFWQSLLTGRSGIGPITLFDATGFKSRIAGEVKNFKPLDYIEPELKPKRMGRHTQFAYAAAMMALKDAGLDPNRLDLPSPTPVVIGISSSAIDVLERAFVAVGDNRPNRAPGASLKQMIPQAAANLIADRLGVCAHAETVSSACPSGLDALAVACELIQTGQAEAAVAGGADTAVTPLAMSMFISGNLSSCFDGDPEQASRPFNSRADSGVIAEGAGVFFLENLDRVKGRGAHSYAEIVGYGKCRDRDPEKPASGLEDSMRLALANAGRRSEAVDYISAYGTGHPVLDAAEVKMIKRVFGDRAYRIPVSSIKGATGNAMAAAGPFQVAAAALTIRDQLIPPTLNLDAADPVFDLDFVPHRPRRCTVNCVLINVRGLGGSASSMILSRIPKDE